MSIVKIREKYQVTIPEDVREKIACEVGEYVRVESQGSHIVVTPLVVEEKFSEQDVRLLEKALRAQKPGKTMSSRQFARRLREL